MPDDQAVDVVGHLKDQPVYIRKWALIASDLANDKSAQAAEAGEIEIFRLFEHEIGDMVGKLAPEIAPDRVPLLVIAGIYYLLSAALSEGEQALDLFRRVL